MIKMSVNGANGMKRMQDFRTKLMAKLESQLKPATEEGQETVREVLRERILRPRESTSRLENAIEGHLVWTANHDWAIGIGKTSDLNTNAPYWNQIEEGSMVHIGMQVGGYFVDSAGNYVKFDPSNSTAISAGEQGMGYAKISEDAFIHWARNQYNSVMTIRQPIESHYYFRDGGRLFYYKMKARMDKAWSDGMRMAVSK